MKKTVLILAAVVAFLAGFTMDSGAHMRAGCGGTGMEMGGDMPEMGPGMCGSCMAMSGEGPMMGAGMVEMMIKHLELDAKQASAFKAAHLKMKKESIQKKAELQIAVLELGELSSNEPVDMKAAEAKIRQIESLRSDMKILHLRTHEQVKGMLTPAQKIKLESIMEKRMGGNIGMMRKCRMMGDMEDMGPAHQMEESDMQGGKGEGHNMPTHEGHGH
jgi:Spy/CpxP family protein refolding chaperone